MNFVAGIIVAMGLLVASILFLIATEPGLLETEYVAVPDALLSVTGAMLCDCHAYGGTPSLQSPDLA